ncbi:MAG: substrate-binding domain-containing protein [Streptomyces sp.]|nr:substrate-binding domain-containing protein [Streptomyces sp.]
MSTRAAHSTSRRKALLITTAVGLAGIVLAFVVPRLLTAATGPDCEVRLEISSSTEKGELLAEMADDYRKAERTFADGQCAEVSVTELTSGSAMEALARGWDEKHEGRPEPQAWTPTSSLWLDLLAERAAASDRGALSAGEPVSLATSPLAIAMPRPMAEALGWPSKQVGWRDVLALTEKGWGSLGHPEWGSFHLGKDNPHTSTSGLAATVAAFYAATGRSSDLTSKDVATAGTRDFVAGVEAGVLHYASDATVYMANLAEADAEGQAMSYASAVLVQEQLIHLYNQGSPKGDPELIGEGRKPRVPLVAVHPSDGTLMLDHPFVVLPSASKAQRAAAADFRAFLLDREQQRRFQEMGFRDHAGNAATALAESVSLSDGHELSLIDPPAPKVLGEILDSWDDLRKKARVTLVMDVSGSMNQPAGNGRSRLEAAKEAAISSLDQYHEDDEVGLWVFSTETDDHPDQPYRVILPPAPIGGDNKARMSAAIRGLSAEGGTALYSSVRAAHTSMLEDLDPDRINALVVLTDGKNEYPADNDRSALLRDIDADAMERSVRVFTVAFGEESDFDTLTEIAEASRASSYDARDPALIDKVMTSVISNF